MHKILLLPLSSLRRVGPAMHKSFLRLIGQDKIFNLLLHQPLRNEIISICPRLFEVQHDELIIIKAKIESHTKPSSPRQPYKVTCYTPSGYFNLIFFKTYPGQMEKLKIGREIAVLGNLQKTLGENQMSHPQEIIDADKIETLPKFNIIYPLSYLITQKFLRQKISEVVTTCQKTQIEEWIDENLLKKMQWPTLLESIEQIHYFKKGDINKARQRLAYDELLAWQIAINLAKKHGIQYKEQIDVTPDQATQFINSLPFTPTNAQTKVMQEIESDIASNKKMLRLLQGDVGSGKTIVAIYACLLKISQQKQACVIVPISILAKQHFAYFEKLLENSGIKIALLTSATTKKQRAKILEELESGQTNIIIGTHALIEDDIKFKDLGLAVIDEQHRFGVVQRMKLVQKGQNTDSLLMSATPIPRSLMMGLYGDMDISVINEKPQERQEIETLVMSAKKINDVQESIKRALQKGEKIYWICPAVEESEPDENGEIKNDNDLTSAKEKHEELASVFGQDQVALIHGKMKESEKNKIMNQFIDKDSDIKMLVATTVIEVGIDVKDATIIVIENAEHFGLSQLHQLRGRVGRGDKKSYCLLLYGKKYGTNARQRLGILKDSNDGFFIAEEDLKMRGSGEMLGTRQSGFPEFRVADLALDNSLLQTAHKNAAYLLQQDKNLELPENKKYQHLLALFNYDECLKMKSSG